MSAANIHFFFLLQNSLKLYHWQTHSYARHVATDKVLEELLEHIDKYVEIYNGKYDRSKLLKDQGTIITHNMTEAGILCVIIVQFVILKLVYQKV